MFTSNELREGHVYTRADLQIQFDISDATIKNGVFRPAGRESVWLFVTENKTPDRTQYVDQLDGDTLHWDGQQEGRTDPLIIEHERHGLELIVFYRRSKKEYPGAGFRYEGRFRYVSHSGAHPTHFELVRHGSLTDVVTRDVEAAHVEEGHAAALFMEGGARSVLINRYERNPRLRTEAIHIHGTRCQTCGFSFEETYGDRGKDFIEVHHLRPVSTYTGEEVAVNPATDMAVLCANCHRMVHRAPGRPLTIEELRALVVRHEPAANRS